MTDTRVVERDWAVSEIADAIRDRLHWIIGATPEHLGQVSEVMPESWRAAVYLDSGTPIILVGTSNTAHATALILPALGMQASAVFVIPKANVTAAELNTVAWPTSGSPIPEDGSQDLVLFAEPLDDDHQIGYMPALIEQAVYVVDNRA